MRLLGECIATRAAVTIAISSWRSAQGLEDPVFAERYNDKVARTAATLLDTGWDEVARRFGAEVPARGSERALIARRRAAFGPALEHLCYVEPIHMVEAAGVWMIDADGRRYLDAYNNVPCVGHGHPRVTEAVARQARRLNTNLRYLHESAIELAERLIATCPPGARHGVLRQFGLRGERPRVAPRDDRDRRRGGLCTDFAYHGIPDAIAALRRRRGRAAGRRPMSRRGCHPTPTAGMELDGRAFQAAIDDLVARGTPPAAAILDGVLPATAIPTSEPTSRRRGSATRGARAALWIADEVQGGHGRTGDAMWSFEHLGLDPGHRHDRQADGQRPSGRRGHHPSRDRPGLRRPDRVLQHVRREPGRMAAALAVLDVIEDERILARTEAAGQALRAALRAATAGHDAVREVRGVGLAVGVACRDGATARALKEGMRSRGVLVGSSGRHGDVLKIRPPLAFTVEEVPIVASALAESLEAVSRRRR